VDDDDLTHEGFGRLPSGLPPLPRDEAIFPAAAHQDLYQALIGGFPEQERDDLEHLMIDNIERLRSDGDSYAP
jgi:hypothetical protein